MRLVYDPRGLSRRPPDPKWLSVTNGIRVDPRGFTGAYGLFEKDTVAYRSGT
jgi:hypothetical protein